MDSPRNTELNIEMIPDSCSFHGQINQSFDIVRALGLKSIVNVVCRICKKFGADYFRERLTAVSVHEFLTMKMFPIFDSWRKNSKCEQGGSNSTSSVSDIEIWSM